MEDDDWLVKKAKYLTENSSLILIVIGTVFLTISGAFGNNIEESIGIFKKEEYFKLIYSSKIIYMLIGAILLYKGTKNFNSEYENLKGLNLELKKENKEIENLRDELNSSKEDIEKLHSRVSEKHQELVKTWLKLVTSELNLTVNERLTIYFEHDKEFTLLARFSQNQKYTDIHKQKFPLDKGVISEAWARNEHIESDSPIFKNNEDEYYGYMMNKYKFLKKEIISITMKSDKLFGIAIQEADENIGVLLYERISNSGEKSFDDNCAKIREHYKNYSSYFRKFVDDAKKLDRSNVVKDSLTFIKEDESELMKRLGGL